MIDPKELRLGNYVLSDGIQVEVLSLDVDADILTTANFEGSLNGNIHPIPITPEWLERLGFVRQPSKISNALVYKNGDYMILFGGSGYYTFHLVEMGAHYLCEIKYIHQLQNLYFALTGNELTIKE